MLEEPRPSIARPVAEDPETTARRLLQKTPLPVTRAAFERAPGGKNVKGRQAWRYPGGVIERADTIYLNGRYYTDPKEAEAGAPSTQGEFLGGDTGTPRRKQESTFFITINPNQRVSAPLEHKARGNFERALAHLQEPATLAQCLKFGPKDSHYASDKAGDVLTEIEWNAKVEVGEKLGRMHAHIICRIVHYSQVQVDTRAMQYHFRTAYNSGLVVGDALAMSNPPYIHIKMLPQSNWSQVYSQYMVKGMSN